MSSRRPRRGPFDVADLLFDAQEATARSRATIGGASIADFSAEKSTQDDRPPSFLRDPDPTLRDVEVAESNTVAAAEPAEGFDWGSAWVGATASESDHLEGAGIPGYRLGPRLASGTYAHVYRAHAEGSDEVYAIKVLRARLIAEARARQRLRREGEVLSRIRHPRLVRVFQVGLLPDGRPFHVMEYLGGETLQAWLRRRGAIPADEAVLLARQIAEGLVALHTAGVTHRDLKPANIMVLSTPGQIELKLLDLGLAGWIAPEERTRLTMRSQLLGTPAYMAPEQIHEPQSAGPAADVYALGGILFELIEGTRPFAGTSDVALMYAHLKQPVPHPVATGPLADLVVQMLAKDPAARPTAREVLARLQPPGASAPPSRSPLRSSLVGALVGITVLGLALGFFGSALQSNDALIQATPEPPPSATSAAGEPEIEATEPVSSELEQSAMEPPAPPPPHGSAAAGPDSSSPPKGRATPVSPRRASRRPPTEAPQARPALDVSTEDQGTPTGAEGSQPADSEDWSTQAQRVVGLLRLLAEGRPERLSIHEKRYFQIRRRLREPGSSAGDISRELRELERAIRADLGQAPEARVSADPD